MKNKLLLVLIFSGFFISINSSTINRDFNQIEKENEKIAFEKKALCIAEAIKSIESAGNYTISGLSGEYGAYQFMPKTWNRACLKYFGTVLSMTPYNQDFVALTIIKDRLNKGYSPGQIASIWNCGSPNYSGRKGVNRYGIRYDVPLYVEKFQKKYKILLESID